MIARPLPSLFLFKVWLLLLLLLLLPLLPMALPLLPSHCQLLSPSLFPVMVTAFKLEESRKQTPSIHGDEMEILSAWWILDVHVLLGRIKLGIFFSPCVVTLGTRVTAPPKS
uniref:Uncharacterized protein n=1 Tax=Oryza brachyantha TaxID=4533 RepID=J3L121_ORYBR